MFLGRNTNLERLPQVGIFAFEFPGEVVRDEDGIVTSFCSTAGAKPRASFFRAIMFL